jgi:alkylation response protein AidB-like acyl-CoA dehydrogenase
VDFTFTPEELAFRDELHEFLVMHRPRKLDDSFESQLDWQKTLFEGSWVAPHWPKEFGGRGCSVTEFALYVEEMGRHRVPQIAGGVGINMVGSTLLAHGRPDQKARYLRPMLAGDEIWCQLLSEPDAGSDLRSIATRAVQDGDSWVVTGQKVWSSSAAQADFGYLFAKTTGQDGAVGATCLICDMHTEGVDVRPLRQLTGDSHFCEVFLTEVRIPIDHVIGPVGQGWRILQTTLSNERGLAYPMKEQIVLSQFLGELLDVARKPDRQPLGGELRDQLVQCVIQDRIFRLLNLRTLSRLADGGSLGANPSITKLFYASYAQRLQKTAMTLKGMGAIAGSPAEWTPLLWYRQSSIAGGTSEIQRNILAEVALGLPRDPRN